MTEDGREVRPSFRIYYEAITGGGYSSYPRLSHGGILPQCHKVVDLYTRADA